jgi:CBS-domain-containing membrane protein
MYFQSIVNISNTLDKNNGTDISHKNPYIPTRDTTSIRDVLQKFSQGIHRVPIVDENDRVVFVLSQMFLFRYFFKKHTEQYEQLKNKTVSELNLGSRGGKDSMFAVRENQLAIDAFKQIADNGISAVGILDANEKKLIGVLSASDLQGLLDEDFFVLGQTVLQFKLFSLEKKRNRGIEEPARDPVVFCKLNNTLEHVIHRIEANQVHRIFIMDDEMQMLGVISLTDLFKLIYENL